MAQTKEQAHAWYLKNKERRKLINEVKREHIAAVKHAYYLKNIESRKAKDRAYYLANREKRLKWQREYYESNSEKVRSVGKAWREKNPESVKANSKAYRESHREYRAVHNAKRRALKNGSQVSPFTVDDWRAIKEAYGNKCVYCRGKKPLTKDHVIPLSKGGKHDKLNIVPACRSCNSRKNSREAPMYQPVLFV